MNMYLTGIKQYLQLRNNQKKSLDQLKAEQWMGFRRIVKHAYLNVPFYRDLYKTGLEYSKRFKEIRNKLWFQSYCQG